MSTPEPAVLGIADIARELRVSKAVATRIAHACGRKTGRSWRVPRSWLIEFLASHSIRSRKEQA